MHLVWVAPQLWRDACFPQNDELFFVYYLWSLMTGSPSCHRSDYFFHFEGRFCCLQCIISVSFPMCYYAKLCTFHEWVHGVVYHLEKLCFTNVFWNKKKSITFSINGCFTEQYAFSRCNQMTWTLADLLSRAAFIRSNSMDVCSMQPGKPGIQAF